VRWVEKGLDRFTRGKSLYSDGTSYTAGHRGGGLPQVSESQLYL